MTKYKLKTKLNDMSVAKFIDSIEDESKSAASYELIGIMQKASGEEPKMWGKSIVGFGKYHYQYASGQEGDWMLTAFSPRKNQMTIYIMNGFDSYTALLSKLGPYTTGKSCLYLKKWDEIDKKLLQEIIKDSVDYMRKTYQ